MFRRIKAYFGHLKGNAAVCIGCHPFWSVPYMFYTYYISLYLLEKGITDAQLGTLMVAGTLSATVSSFLSAPLVDWLGRKNAASLFDFLSSALPPLVYFFTHSFGTALLAMVLFNLNRVMSVGYFLVMIEDSDDQGQITAMNLFNAISVIAGLLLPLAGILVEKKGLADAERTFLLSSFVIMTLMITVRHLLLKETKVGEKKKREMRTAGQSPGAILKNLWKPYGDALRFLFRDPVARSFTLIDVFFCVYMNLGTNYSLYFVPFFADRLGMDTMQSSVLGSVYYGGMLAAMVFINPRMEKKNLVKSIAVSAAISLAGMAMMVLVPAGVYWTAILATLTLALGYGMLKSSTDGGFAVYSDSDYRSGIYSVANLLSSGLGVVVTAVCAALYGRFAGWLYILCGAMVLAMLVCLGSVRKKLE